MKFVMTSAAFALIAAAGANAQTTTKIYDTGINALTGIASNSTYASRSVDEFYGFETAEGYTINPINGQNGWTEFAAGPGAARVTDANPATGNQNLRIIDTGAAGALQGGFSPDLGAQPNGFYSTSVDVAINDDAGSDYDIIGQAPSQALLSWRVKFNFGGNIFVLDDIGTGREFIDTGVAWNLGLAYTNLQVDLDSDANSIDYYYGGNLIYSSVAGVFAGTSIEQVIILSDGFQFLSNTPNPTGDFDNLSIEVPTPGAFALMGIAGIAATRRRR